MDKHACVEVMAVLTSATLSYAPAELDQAQMLVWYDSLRDLTRDECVTAVRRWVQTRSTWPTPADVRALAKVVRREAGPRELGTGEHAPYRCRCEDVGMVLEDAERFVWRPCERCNSGAHARWKAGQYAPKTFARHGDRMDADVSRAALAKAREVLRNTGAQQPDYDPADDEDPVEPPEPACAPDLTVDVADNPVIRTLYGPDGATLVELREREPIGFRLR